MAELLSFDRDPSWRRLWVNSMNSTLLFSTIHLNLTLALVREISTRSVFLLHNNNNSAKSLLNRQSDSGRSVYGGELPWSYFSPWPNPSTQKQSFPGFLGLQPHFSKRKREENPANLLWEAWLVLTDDQRSQQKMTSIRENLWYCLKRQDYLTFLKINNFHIFSHFYCSPMSGKYSYW